MDYEKAYKAVLQTATQWIKDGCTDKEKICLECVFPELRESEDKRIGNVIYCIIRDDKEVKRILEGNGVSVDNALSYLEKQEQKPNIELVQRSWYMEGYYDRDFFMEPKWILKTGEGGPKYELNPRYGKSLILGPEPCCCSVNVESEYDKGWRDEHKAGLKDAEMQKPFGQRDECKDCQANYAGSCKGTCEIMQQEQKPAWSEEDEKMMDDICSHLYATPEERGKMQNWLKSLRPSWKPSEEQTEALRRAVKKLANTDVSDSVRLSIMYDNLKKL